MIVYSGFTISADSPTHSIDLLQKDIIEPVRNALDYYTQMQKSMEEEEKNAANEKPKQNGLTAKMNGDIKVWQSDTLSNDLR